MRSGDIVTTERLTWVTSFDEFGQRSWGQWASKDTVYLVLEYNSGTSFDSPHITGLDKDGRLWIVRCEDLCPVRRARN